MATYNFAFTPGSINEGSSQSFLINSNDGDFTTPVTLYWTTTGVTANADVSDFAANTGSFSISGNAIYGQGSFSVAAYADSLTEGAEIFQVQIRTGSIGGPIVATSANVTINDTSLGAGNVTYWFRDNRANISEGGTYTLNRVDTTNVANGTVLYWSTTGGNATVSDFTANTGSFTVNGNSGVFSITTVADATTEGDETFQVQIRTSSVTGNIVLTSNLILIYDTSFDGIPTYSFSSVPATINEGSSGVFTANTANVANGTVLYWSTTGGNATVSDFTANTGSFTVTSNVGTFSISIVADETTEGNETFQAQLRTGSVTGTIVATSNVVYINDTSTTPLSTYTFSSIPSSINEGSSGVFTANTTNVANATTLYWSTTGGNATVSDFTANTGSFTVASNVGTFSVTTVADETTEGNETFQIQLRTSSVTGTIVATSNVVYINDTSTTPLSTYTFSSIPSSINEGSSGVFTANTTNVANATTLYWSTTGGNATVSDFTANTGSFTVASNVGTFSVTTVADETTEGNETFQIQLRTSSVTGTIVATSNVVYISDTSTTPPVLLAYVFTTTPATINEGSSGTFNVTTTNVANVTTLYWSTTGGNATVSDFTANTGSFIVTSNTGSFSVSIVSDATTEGNETFRVQLRTSNTSGNVVLTSNLVYISDTSTTPTTYTFSSIPSSINEGSSGTFNVTTTNVANATTLYWTVGGGASRVADFSANTGSFSITSGAGSFSVTPASDSLTEGTETFQVQLRTDNIGGTIVATSANVTINDTSTSSDVYVFTTTPATIDEGSSGTFNVTTTNVANATTIYWKVVNISTDGLFDFTSNSGSTTVINDVASFYVTPYADSRTEGNETFQVEIRKISLSGNIVATSNVVTIIDTSKKPLVPITLTANSLYFDGDITMSGVKISFVK